MVRKRFPRAAYLILLYHFFFLGEPGTGAFAVMAFLVSIFFFLDVIPARIKAALVYWRLKDPYASCRAFSVIAKKDPRIDPTALTALFKGRGMPADPMDQNDSWSEFHDRYRQSPSVLRPSRMFRIARDFSVLTFLSIPVFFASDFVSGFGPETAVVHGMVLFALFAALASLARVYGNRVVAEVLLLAIAGRKERI